MGRVVPEAEQKVAGPRSYIYLVLYAPAQCSLKLLRRRSDREVQIRNIKMRYIILAAVLAVAQARPSLLFTQPLHPIGVEYVHSSAPAVQSHPAAELNAASEALLPRELLKSRDFYDNPAVAAGLAKESWFTNKEMQVVEREAEKIPRESIYHIVKNAGFLDRH